MYRKIGNIVRNVNVSLRICLKTHSFNLSTLFKHLLTGVILAIENVVSLYSVYYTYYMTTNTKKGLVTNPCGLDNFHVVV